MKNNYSHWRVCLLLSVVLCAVIMKTCLGVNAAGTINWNFMDGTLTISGTGEMEDCSNGSQPWNEDLNSIQQVVIEEGVSSVAAYLCFRASNLETVSLPSTITRIGGSAFRTCVNLTSLSIPGSVSEMGTAICLNSSRLESVILGEGITYLGDRMFESTSNLKEITWPVSLTLIGNDALKNTTSLDTIRYAGTIEQWKDVLRQVDAQPLKKNSLSVNCTDGVFVYDESLAQVGQSGDVSWVYDDNIDTLMVYGSGAMQDYANGTQPWNAKMSDIRYVVVSEGVTTVSAYLCFRASNLEYVELPSTVIQIGASAFRTCGSLKTFTIPGSVESIGNAMCLNQTGLEQITFKEGISYLSDRMLEGATNLKTIVWPKSLYELGSDSLKNTNALTTIIYGGTIEEWKNVLWQEDAERLRDGSIAVTCADGTYVYSEECFLMGTTGAVNWVYDLQSKRMTVYGNGAMGTHLKGEQPWYSVMTEMESLVVKEGVTTVCDYMCWQANQLQYVSLSDTIDYIGQRAFSECHSLCELDIPGSVCELGLYTCYASGGLEEIGFGSGITGLSEKMLMNSTGIKTINWPKTLTSIGSHALKGLYLLETINYSGTVSEWKTLLSQEKYASPLKDKKITVNCADGVYIYGIFGQCGNSIAYTLDESTGILTITGSGSMEDYTSADDVPWAAYTEQINKVVLKMGVTYVGSNCFANCTAIESVVYIGNQNDWNTLCETAGDGNDSLFAADVLLRSEGRCGENVTWQLSNQGRVLTISGSGAMDNYENPDEVPWRDSRDTITTVIIESGVTSVGYYALAYCEELVDVSMAGSVEILETYAFRQSTKLQHIILPEGLNIIGAKAFYDCTSLESITFPSTLTNIDMRAFGACYKLKSISYQGTCYGWDLVEISINENGNLTGENITFLQSIPIASEDFSDITAADWYNASVQYMYERGLMAGENGVFGSENLLSGTEVLGILYINSGAPANYGGPEAWARSCSLISDTPQTFDQSTLSALLYRYMLYNTYPQGQWENIVFTEEEANLWAEANGFWSEIENSCSGWDDGMSLTRVQGASVLAAFLQSEKAVADRILAIYGKIKSLISQGGDGRLHIICPNLSGIVTKPGDVTFMLTPNGKTILIDTAAEQAVERVIGFLEAVDVKTLDYLIITHPDADHIGNVQAVAEFICETQNGSIVNYWLNFEDSRDNRVSTQSYLVEKGTIVNNEVRAGDQLTIDGVDVLVFGPEQSDFQDSVVNNHSIVMKFTYGTSTFLTGGDIYTAKENGLMEVYGNQLQADVMKTNHHGSYTSNSVNWIEQIDPQIAFTCSNDNGCSVTCKVFGEKQIVHYSSGMDGVVMISMDNQCNYEVNSGYDSRLRGSYE